MTIQIALNGNRNDKIVPKTMESIIESAILSIDKGAKSIHFHPRDDKGNETFIGKYIDEQIGGLRKNLKNIPIGISTGEWIEPNLNKRLEYIDSWKILPDFVSINYDENGFEKVTNLITKKGIKIEAGLSSLESAKNFTKSNLKGDFLRILIEPQEQTLDLAIENVNRIENHIKSCGIKLPFLLHGTDKTCWDLLKIAFEKNYLTRIGFEDTLTMPNGEKAKSNDELIRQAQKIKNLLLTLYKCNVGGSDRIKVSE